MEKNELKEKAMLVKKDYDLFFDKFSNELNKLPTYLKKKIQKIIVKYPNVNLKFFSHLLHLSDYVNKIFKKIFKYSYAIIFYCEKKIIDSIALQVNYTPKNVKKVKMPPELQADYLVTDEIDNANENIKVAINKFIEALHNNFSEEMLLYFYRNIGSLDTQIMTKENDSTKSAVIVGSYRGDKNRMKVVDETDESTIFHELFHLASSYYDSRTKMSYCGFKQNNRSASYNIGTGINEGYTQLLTNRYTEEDPYSYPKETRIAEIIESVIGKENMQKHYFMGNLKGLIDELAKYKSKEEVMKFIQMIDFNLEYRYQKSLLPSKDKKLENSKQYIEKFMLDICLNKLKLEIANKDISLLKNELQQLYMKINHNTIPNFNFAEYVSQVLECNITINECEDGTIKVNIENLPDFKINKESKKGMSL